MPDYPEHEKLAIVADDSQKLGEFLDWIRDDQGWHMAEWDENGFGDQHLFYIGLNTTQILARYFKIDLDKLEAEKLHMLEEQRIMNQAAEVRAAQEKIGEQYADTFKKLAEE